MRRSTPVRRLPQFAGLVAGALLVGVLIWTHLGTAVWADEPAAAAAAADTGGAIPSRSLLGIIHAGGILMIPILFCSLLTVAFTFERLIALRTGRVVPGPFVKRFLHQLRTGKLDREGALRLCEENGSPVAGVFQAALRKWGRPGVEVEQAVLDEGERTVNGLRRYTRVFNGVATIAPLLGLLGTVTGMISAFNVIAASDAMGRPEMLAAGISEALITTAAGLVVAIPSLTAYMYFISRVDQLIVAIDALGQELVRIISAEAQLENPLRPGRGRKEAA